AVFILFIIGAFNISYARSAEFDCLEYGFNVEQNIEVLYEDNANITNYISCYTRAHQILLNELKARLKSMSERSDLLAKSMPEKAPVVEALVERNRRLYRQLVYLEGKVDELLMHRSRKQNRTGKQ
ncbi:MAG: hypothetical protein AAGE89_11250, partial [Pseudomonadota bacterium]